MSELDAAGRGLAVRNSVSLGVFLAVAADPKVPFSVVELAGRGVTADAAATRWVLEVGKPSLDAFTLGDKLIERAEWEDRLVGLWQEHGRGEVAMADFQVRLAEIVHATERWPTLHRPSPVIGPGTEG